MNKSTASDRNTFGNGLQRALTTLVNRARRFFRPVPYDYAARFAWTLKDWLLYHQREVIFKDCNWMGVPIYKNPCDIWIYQELLYRVKPDVLIEIGSCKGGSTLYFAHLFDMIGAGQVLSIDIDRSDFRVSHPRIVVLTGSSSSAEIVEQVRNICRDKKVMLLHDGDHRKPQVLADLEAYASLVTSGSYLIVEDGIIDLFRPRDSLGSFEPGPLAAVEEFLKSHPEFQIDSACERYLITNSPRGFLRKT